MDKKNTKAEIRKEKERRNKIKNAVVIVVTGIALIGALTAAVIYSQEKAKNNKEKNTVTDVSDSITVDKERNELYSQGIDSNGMISGIDDIDDYVKLYDISEILLFEDDFEDLIEHGQIIKEREVVIGEYILENLMYNSEIISYQPYYEIVYSQYEFVSNKEFERYNEIYEQNNKEKWETIQSFYGISDIEYRFRLSRNAFFEMRYNLVCQAVAEKFDIELTQQDIEEYCISTGKDYVEELRTEAVIAKYGEAFTKQQALRYKIVRYLGETAVLKEGSKTELLKDENDKYGNGLYESGKIEGVGNIFTYCVGVDYKKAVEKCESGKDAFECIYENADISGLASYKSVIEEKYGVSSEEAEEIVNRQLLVQYLYTEFELKGEDFEREYLFVNGFDNEYEEKVLFEKGKAFYNREIMEYSVIRYLDLLIEEK